MKISTNIRTWCKTNTQSCWTIFFGKIWTYEEVVFMFKMFVNHYNLHCVVHTTDSFILFVFVSPTKTQLCFVRFCLYTNMGYPRCYTIHKIKQNNQHCHVNLNNLIFYKHHVYIIRVNIDRTTIIYVTLNYVVCLWYYVLYMCRCTGRCFQNIKHHLAQIKRHIL